MSAFDQLTPLIPQVPDYSQQPKMLLSPPASLSSPVIKKTPIQIPSFDERGLVCANEPNTDRSLLPIRGNLCNQAPSKPRSHEERLSTLQRIKPKPRCLAKPSISTSPAPNMNRSVPFTNLKPVPGAETMHLGTTQLKDPAPSLQTADLDSLMVPTLQPSPTSQSQENKQLTERQASSISISNTEMSPHDILDQDALLTFTHKDVKNTGRGYQKKTFQSCNPPGTCQNSSLLREKLDGIKTGPKSKLQFKSVQSPVSPKTNIKQQSQNVPSDRAVSDEIRSACVSGSTSQSMFEGLSPHLSPSLHRRCIQYLQNASLRKPSKQKSCKEPASPKMSKSMDTPESMEPKRNEFYKDTFTSRTPSPKAPIQSTGYVTTLHSCVFSKRPGLSQMDTGSTLHQSNTVSKDCSCQSDNIEVQEENTDHAKTLNQCKTCLPQTMKSYTPDSNFVKLKELLPESHISNKAGTGHNKKHISFYGLSGMPFRNTESQHVMQPAFEGCYPLTKTCSPMSFEYNLQLQPNKETLSHSLLSKPQNSTSVCVTEEDPYVTMYCLGSVYEGK